MKFTPVVLRSPSETESLLQKEERIRAKYPMHKGFFYGFLSEHNVFYPWEGRSNVQNTTNGFVVDVTDTTPTGWIDAENNLLNVGDDVIVNNGGLKRGVVESLPPYWHHVCCGWCVLVIKVRDIATGKLVTVKDPKHIIKN